MGTKRLDLLAHRAGDTVAVAVTELGPGTFSVSYLDESPGSEVAVADQIPLGHKVALHDVAAGAQVIEYGTVVGRATRDIETGQHVHVHNLKGERWV